MNMNINECTYRPRNMRDPGYVNVHVSYVVYSGKRGKVVDFWAA